MITANARGDVLVEPIRGDEHTLLAGDTYEVTHARAPSHDHPTDEEARARQPIRYPSPGPASSRADTVTGHPEEWIAMVGNLDSRGVRRRVVLRDADPDWPGEFERERRAISTAVASLGRFRVEHIGSTAIPGIRAKPTIDIMVGVVTYDPFEGYRERFASLGYDYDANALRDEPGRYVFRKGPSDPARLRTHHLHFTRLGSPYWLRILAFRDYLRANPEVAREYEQLKTELAARYAGDGRRYTKAKGAFVRRVQETALSDVLG